MGEEFSALGKVRISPQGPKPQGQCHFSVTNPAKVPCPDHPWDWRGDLQFQELWKSCHQALKTPKETWPPAQRVPQHQPWDNVTFSVTQPIQGAPREHSREWRRDLQFQQFWRSCHQVLKVPKGDMATSTEGPVPPALGTAAFCCPLVRPGSRDPLGSPHVPLGSPQLPVGTPGMSHPSGVVALGDGPSVSPCRTSLDPKAAVPPFSTPPLCPCLVLVSPKCHLLPLPSLGMCPLPSRHFPWQPLHVNNTN